MHFVITIWARRLRDAPSGENMPRKPQLVVVSSAAIKIQVLSGSKSCVAHYLVFIYKVSTEIELIRMGKILSSQGKLSQGVGYAKVFYFKKMLSGLYYVLWIIVLVKLKKNMLNSFIYNYILTLVTLKI